MKSLVQELSEDLGRIFPSRRLTTREFVKRHKRVQAAKKGTPEGKGGPVRPGKDPTKKKGK